MDRRISPRLAVSAVLLASVNGCNCAHQRQAVYPNPTSSAVEVQTGEDIRVRAPFVDVRVPNKSMPIDVPMLDD